MKTLPIIQARKKTPTTDIRSEFDSAIESFYRLFDQAQPVAWAKYESMQLFPSIDVVEDDKTYKIEVEMPGMGEEDVKVAIENNVLTVTGEKTLSKKDQDKNYLHREITYGAYARAISLPDYLELDAANASFKKGMLWVEIPKKAEFGKQKRELKIEKVA